MKKIILVLALLVIATFVIATPALGEVKIYSIQTDANEVTDHEVTIFFDATTETTKQVRAFALDVTLGPGPGKTVYDAKITSVASIDPNSDYYVFPGSIRIDANNGKVTNWGTVAVGGPPADSNKMTIEMGSLYATNDAKPSHKAAPQKKGSLCAFRVDKTCSITLSKNTLRGGVVMEDGSQATVNFVGQASPGLKVSCRGDMKLPKDGKVKKEDMIGLTAYLGANAAFPSWTVSKFVGGVLNPAWDDCGNCKKPRDTAIKKEDMIGLTDILARRAAFPSWTYTCP